MLSDSLVKKMEISYEKSRQKEKENITHEFSMGAIAMLQMISEGEGWEESETFYYKKFFEKDLKSITIKI